MQLDRRQARRRRHKRVRQKVRGSAERPRVAVHRSNRHISAQVIDDDAGRTLVAATTVSKAGKAPRGKNSCNCSSAEKLGRQVGAQLKAKGIARVVFDRGGCLYHGVVKAFADGVRSADEDKHFDF